MSTSKNWFSLLAILAILFSFNSIAYANSDISTFEKKWEEKTIMIENEERPLSEAIHSTLRERHVLFVPGIMNELAALVNSYFSTSMQSLGRIGVSTSIYGPSSAKPILENSEIIYDKAIETFYSVGKPLILVGHSKGGAEVLLAVLNHPELLLNNIVDRVVLIQPAVGGSNLVELNWWNLQMQALGFFCNSGLQSLAPSAAKETFQNSYHGLITRLSEGGKLPSEVWQKELNQIKQKIFYVRSQADSDYSPGIRFVLSYVQKALDGPGDGLLLLENQKLSPDGVDFGIDLGVVKSDHIGLTVSYFGNKTEDERTAFTLALFERIYGDCR